MEYTVEQAKKILKEKNIKVITLSGEPVSGKSTARKGLKEKYEKQKYKKKVYGKEEYIVKEGYNVNAIELVEHNLEVLKANAKGVKNIVAEQGDALDLTRFDDDVFDMVLVLGPMYHLYSKKDQIQAVNEAIRVCKPNGIIMFAYLTDGSIVFDWGTEGNMKEIKKQLNPDFSVKQRPQDLFISFTIYNFEKLLNKTGTTKLHQVATDGIIPICENNPNFKMDDEDFEILKQYHLATCERIDMQGLSGHMLYICRKD